MITSKTPGGDESTDAGLQRRASNIRLIKIRSTARTRQINPTMRVTWKGTTFEIEAAYEPTEDRRDVVVECKEIT